ncbi:MAG: hypothetical protein QOE68_3569 [Thermoanaerobaculia bacterium]|nr:hypothetical protein [Thermoanaerobaculia bacterium]
MPEADLDERQQRIYERLKNKAGDGPAKFFIDACRLMRIDPSLETTTHLVGHCVREIESALRDLLGPLGRNPQQPPPNERLDEIRRLLAAASTPLDDPLAVRWQDIALEEGGETHKAEIRMILAAVGIAESDEVAVTWLRLAGTKKTPRLADRAHRSGLSARPLDEEFRAFWSEVQTVLDVVLERFETRYLVYIEMLKRLLTKNVPDAEDVTTLKNAIPRTLVTYRYFFERLESPGWFRELRRKGFFSFPFPGYWPQAVYLRKVAPMLPQDVLNVMLSVATDGLWTHAEFATAARELPATLMGEWARHEARWIGSQRQIGWPLPQKYGEVITALIGAGEIDAAAELLRSLFSNPPAAETTSVFEEPPSRLEWMSVQHLMEKVVPTLVTHAPLVAFETFADLLASVLQSAHDDLAGVYDGSTLWRESIASDHGLHVGRRNDLVTAVRTSAVVAIRGGQMTAADVVTRLREVKLAIFERLALFILAQFPAKTSQLVAAELFSDLERLREDFDRGEFGMVVAAGFPHLSSEDQRRIVQLIESGPDVAEFRERAEGRGFVITDAHVRRYVLQWQTRYTEVLHVPEELRERYAQWKEELATVVTSLEPPPATRTLEQLRGMEPTDVVAYFRTMSLSQRPEHSRFDIGRDLQQLVAAAPEAFSHLALETRELEPSLIHWFLYGLNQAAQQKQHAIDWPAVIELLEFVVEQPLETTWAAARRSTASILERGLSLEEPVMPRELATRLWTVLVRLLERDPGDESVDVTGDLAKSGNNAVTQAFNSTRGDAFDAAIRLVLWLRRTDASVLHSELRMILESLLDANVSLVTRAALGKNLLHLADLDEQWYDDHLDRLLPRADDQVLAWCAAWSGYLSRWYPSRETFESLREHYSLAVQRLVPTATEQSLAAQAIARHLMDEYWSGFVTLDDPLITRFFSVAPGRTRGRALWYVLRGVDDAGAALPNDVRERVTALLTWRVAASAQQEDRADELLWFGFFFALGRFDEDWSVKTLQSVLKLGVRVEHHEIVERLAVYSRTKPDLAFDCFRRLIVLDEHRFLIDEDSGREIVRNALSSTASRETARAFVNSLGSEGQFQFADLLA